MSQPSKPNPKDKPKPPIKAGDGADSGSLPESDLQKVLEKELPKKLSPVVREAILKTVSVLGYSWSAPLPPPGMMQHYEEILPGISERIMTLTEEEQRIRKRDNGLVLWSDRWKVWGSIVVSLAVVILAAYSLWLGNIWVGLFLGLGGIFGGIIRDVIRRGKIDK